MNISFWSPFRGNSVTNNVTAISYTVMYLYGLKSIVFQSEYDYNNLEMSFMDCTNLGQVKEEFIYYIYVGIDAVLNNISDKKEASIKEYAVEVIKDNAFYLPSTKKNSRVVYEERMNNMISDILNKCNREFEVSFIDNSSGYDTICNKINELSDMVIVNFMDNSKEIDAFMKLNFMDRDRTFYIINNSDNRKGFYKKGFCDKYRVPMNRVYEISQCDRYKEALKNGNAKQFIRRNLNALDEQSNDMFISDIKQIAKMIVRELEGYARR